MLVLDDDNPDTCTVDGQTVRLRPAQFRLLRSLCDHPRKCVRWSTLYAALWPGERLAEPAQMYSIASRLRTALGNRVPIETVPKVGLRLALDPAQIVLVTERTVSLGIQGSSPATLKNRASG